MLARLMLEFRYKVPQKAQKKRVTSIQRAFLIIY